MLTATFAIKRKTFKLVLPPYHTHQEAIEVINLGTDTLKREVNIGATLQDDVKKGFIELLREYADIFAWSYEDMSGLDTDIVMHHFPLKPECPPVKQNRDINVT